ncbi:MAG: acetyl-CoA carboxylase carboxyltransferase subunit alpha [Armatimonadota bacterium]
MRRSILDLERQVDQLEEQVKELTRYAQQHGLDMVADIQRLEAEHERLMREIFSRLSPWDKVQMARHPKRPQTMDYMRLIFDDFLELHGDRAFADDPAMVAGLAVLDGHPVLALGQQKGRDARERALRNFGSARPEGYRKALRLMRLAEKFGRPVVCFVDTPAADCSVGAEERGISEAIARNMREMALLEVPIVVAVIGEGGSGGAVGIGLGDRVLMLENAIYSVIPPEGCAAILWRDPSQAEQAADALKLTADDALRFGVVDEVIPEPLGGAHRDPEAVALDLKAAFVRHLSELCALPLQELLERRYQRFRRLGAYVEVAEGEAAAV